MKNFNLRLAAVAGFTCLGIAGCAQLGMRSHGQDLAGTWMLKSSVNIRDDGSKSDVFGANPKGVLILSPDGHFALVNTRSDMPKFASGNRQKGTAEENQAIVQGSIALYGTYSVNPQDKMLTLKVNGSTWPSWNGTDQKRKYVMLGDDEIKWTLASSLGGTSEATWKRVK